MSTPSVGISRLAGRPTVVPRSRTSCRRSPGRARRDGLRADRAGTGVSPRGRRTSGAGEYLARFADQSAAIERASPVRARTPRRRSTSRPRSCPRRPSPMPRRFRRNRRWKVRQPSTSPRRTRRRRWPRPRLYEPHPAARAGDAVEGPLFRRLRAARRDRPRRHGGRLQGPAGQPQPARRPEDDPGRQLADKTESGASAWRPRPPPASITRHRADPRGRRARGQHYFSMDFVEGGSLSQKSRRAAAASPGGRADSAEWPRPSSTPTSGASSTAT